MKMTFINFPPRGAIVLIFMFFSYIGIVNAQHKLSGVVFSADEGEALPGVSILVKGTGKGSVTDINGRYSLFVNEGDVLQFSYIGFKSQVVELKNESELNVQLEPDVESLEEVVIIGYGEASKDDITGTISSIKSEELNAMAPASFELGLASKMAGVRVVTTDGSPGAGFNVRIRGGSSLNASNSPLYVIDGFPIDGTPQGNSSGLGNSVTSPLAAIDPLDIESIEVLKDASSCAIYGSRGANGVVLITTKSGKSGKAKVTFDAMTSVSTLARKVDLLDGQEFIDVHNAYFPYVSSDYTDVDFSDLTALMDLEESYDKVFGFREIVSSDGRLLINGKLHDNPNGVQMGDPISATDPRIKTNDWQDEITRAAVTNKYHLSISGGSETNKYSGSFSYLNQEGIIKTSGYERYNLTLNIQQDISKKLSTGLKINGAYSMNPSVVSASAGNGSNSGVVTSALLFRPAQTVRQDKNSTYDEDGVEITSRGGEMSNPTRRLTQRSNDMRILQLFGGAFLKYQITKDLSLTSNVRLNMTERGGKSYYSAKEGAGSQTNGKAILSNSTERAYTLNEQLNYSKRIGNHRFNVDAVYEQQENETNLLRSEAIDFNLPGVNIDNLGSAITTLPNRSDYTKYTIQSFLGRVRYSFSNRYNLNVSGRYDGTSRFAQKWGFFPSVGAGWKVSNEKFFQDMKSIISQLHLKASYGEVGNMSIGSYRSLPSAGLANYVFYGNQLTTGLSVNRLANPNLTWETTKQTDIGLTIGVLTNRMTLDVNYYHKNTTGLLLDVPIPVNSGYTTAFKNFGAIENKGFEFAINTVNVDKKYFKWNSSFNISFNRNKILDLGNAPHMLFTAIGSPQISNDFIAEVGQPLGAIYGLKTDGVYNYDDFVDFEGLTDEEATTKVFADAEEQGKAYFDLEYTLKDGVVRSFTQPDSSKYILGNVKYVDINEDGIINNDDLTVIGKTVPKFYGGLTNNFSFKSFDFSIFTTWSYGNDVYNKNLFRGLSSIPMYNKSGLVRDMWTPENNEGQYPGVLKSAASTINGVANSNFVEDGSYFRVSNITMGWRLPNQLVEKVGVQSIRVYGSINNVHVWTKYNGYDPDVSVGNRQLTPGLDYESYPRDRTYRLGITVQF